MPSGDEAGMGNLGGCGGAEGVGGAIGKFAIMFFTPGTGTENEATGRTRSRKLDCFSKTLVFFFWDLGVVAAGAAWGTAFTLGACLGFEKGSD